ncbi:hypothetical protein MMC10_011199 [Thelotrema lepadinum]|nr:hypothetical protein [Thelotrema lepadinum]
MATRPSSLASLSRSSIVRRQQSIIPIRHASTTTQQSEYESQNTQPSIPPEHPTFIHVPSPPQQQALLPRHHKGTLPLPRQIFKKPSDSAKITPHYLSKVTPEPFPRIKTATRAGTEGEYIAFKAASSSLRRQNLREGLRTLKTRQSRTDISLQKTVTQRRARFESAVSAPERPDEYLSRASVLSAMSDPSLWSSAKARSLSERRERYAALMAAREEEKCNKLHTLYVNAKDFIVSNDQLNRRIETVFEEPYWQNNPDMGIWDKEGFPESTNVLLRGAAGKEGNAMDQAEGPWRKLGEERVKRLGEELTGGKM